MTARDLSQDRIEPIGQQPTAVVRPAQDDKSVDDDVYAGPAVYADLDPGWRAGSSHASDWQPEHRARRPRRQVAVAVAIAFLIALPSLVLGLVLSGDFLDDAEVPGLRLLGRADETSPESPSQAEASPGGPQDQLGTGEGNAADSGLADSSALSADGLGAADESILSTGSGDQSQSDAAGLAPAVSTAGSGIASTALVDAGEPVVDVAEIVAPSVVRIEVESDLGLGLGSGIVWDAGNGYIVTNLHVVEGVDEVMVRFGDGTGVEGEVVGGSSAHDVAVVRVDPDEAELVAATFAPASSVRVGQLAVAIGSPFGLTGTVTAGIVSAVRTQVAGGLDPRNPVPLEMIQTDAAINQGNSGGALADAQGRVIGMNTLIQTTSGGNIGLGFAVPSDTVELIATRVIKGESLELGYLGVSGGEQDDSVGVPLAEVVPGSPAEKAGLQPGDVVLAIDGKAVQNMIDLAAEVKLRRPGEVVELTIRRDVEIYAATVVVGAWE